MSRSAKPAGTRDVLPDEMRELRAISRAIVDVLEEAGYGEVRAPALESEGGSFAEGLVPTSPYRLVDGNGETLVLRSDMTVPIARIAATRYASVQPPLRFSYLARAWRRIERGSGEAREFMQAGAELLGQQPTLAEAEVLGVLARVLDAAGLRDWRICVGDSGLVSRLLESAGADQGVSAAVARALTDADFVALDAVLSGVDGGAAVAAIARKRIDADELAGTARGLADQVGADALGPLEQLVGALPDELRTRTIVDFGLSPRIGYYGGLVFEVYDPSFGRPIGSGGRYDRLMEAAGRPMTAVGFSLDVELVHAAIAGEERGEGGAQ